MVVIVQLPIEEVGLSSGQFTFKKVWLYRGIEVSLTRGRSGFISDETVFREILLWLIKNCKGKFWNDQDLTWYFEKEEDAVHFKLVWC